MSTSNFFIYCFLFICSACMAQDELPRRAYWGVGSQQKNDQVVLTSISKGHCFDRANAQVNDVVLAIDDIPITTNEGFRNALRGKKAGHKLSVEVLRNGKKNSLTIVADPFPYEKKPSLFFEYGAFTTKHGDRLRTIVSKPENQQEKLPAILFIQWLSCDAIDAHPQYIDGNIELMNDLSNAGYLIMRTEKPGVGDSEGKPCSEYGFNYELEVHKEALEQLKNRPDVDAENIFIFGSSMGGTMAPMVAQNQNIKGLIVTGCFYKTWYEHMLEIERRISVLSGDTPSVTNDKMRQWSKFYSLYLNDKMAPISIIEKNPAFQKLWEDEPQHQYGRPVSFYMEANEHNVPQYWDDINVPVLVIYGEYDWIMSKSDHQMIAEAMNKKREGQGTYLEVPRASHGLTLYADQQAAFSSYSPEYDRGLSAKVLDWLNGVLGY